MKSLRNAARLGLGLVVFAVLSGCCVLPFGDGHGGRGRGGYSHGDTGRR